ncbi:hypothetical protein [Fibrobacter sp.]|uniref:hypothetical protein n=2 Tax=Fibrobacter TaxID=832 RepID=UPI0025BC5E50|nr:hypothetical protein [Fibrobacter sp.]
MALTQFVSLAFGVYKFYIISMALEIRPIPTLKGQEALAFALAAERVTKMRGRQNFSEQIRKADLILKEAGLI